MKSLIFLLGLGMGAFLGLLVAPEPGRITRRKVREEADKLIDKALTKNGFGKILKESEEPTAVIVDELYSI